MTTPLWIGFRNESEVRNKFVKKHKFENNVFLTTFVYGIVNESSKTINKCNYAYH